MPAPDNKPIQPPLNAEELEVREEIGRHVEMLAGMIGIRHDSRPSSIEAAKAYIRREFESFGQAVTTELYPTPAGDAVNLIVEWPGSTKPQDIVLLGGHYDTVDATPGADDNASAVAGLLSVCRQLAKSRFNRTIRFVAFANEEPMHFGTQTMGSHVHAEACRRRGDRIHAMVCLEMLGYFDTAPGSQRYPPELPGFLKPMLRPAGDFIAVISDMKAALPLRRFLRGFKSLARFPTIAAPVPGVQSLLWVSDHGPFWDRDYPAMIVTDTAWFRNGNYHQPSDTPDTLDFDRMARVVRGVAGGIAALAGRA
ncbi:MAG: M20/M25/M40 family metallo-hydrolase [Planctomycetota bacterium]